MIKTGDLELFFSTFSGDLVNTLYENRHDLFNHNTGNLVFLQLSNWSLQIHLQYFMEVAQLYCCHKQDVISRLL